MAELARRTTGRVVRVGPEFGFIACDDMPQQDAYFRAAWVRGGPLKVDDVVTFQLVSFGDRLQAKNVQRADSQVQTPVDRSAIPSELLEWAYVGYLPNFLSELSGLALKERWEFKNTPPDPERPCPILFSYLTQTFGRLVLEGKVMLNPDRSFAAFNTGLVDRRYEPIYALFVPNDGRTPWQLSGFCIPGEGADGQNLVRNFNPLPQAAHYFSQPADLLYDVRAGEPQLDWRHIIVERIDRYPQEFIEDNCPTGFVLEDTKDYSPEQRRAFFRGLGDAIANDERTYRRMMSRVRDALDTSIKRVAWNFKTAIPTYYPRVESLQLLLPLCLITDDVVDLAMATEKTQAGTYLGHTVLPLDWAYKNARLICRPDSDWLSPEEIEPGRITDEEEGAVP